MMKIYRYGLIGYAFFILFSGGIIRLGGNQDLANIIWQVGALIGALPLAINMVTELLRRQFGVDIIAITAILTSVALGEALAAVVILLMITGGEALEAYASNRAKRELDALLDRAPQLAHRILGTTVEDVAVTQIVPGDLLQIQPGEIVPVDGKIMHGQSSFDQSAITGESLPTERSKGQTILSGIVNTSNLVVVKALKTSADSEYATIVALVSKAAASRAPIVRLANRYSGWFTLITFIIAGLAWLISDTPLRALEVLVVATPCPLILAAPVALIAGMSRAAKTGVIAKNGTALERLAAVRTMAFDKTGTLTAGIPVVADIIAYHGSAKEILTLAASAEAGSTHVLARAIATAAKVQKLKLSKTTSLHEETGLGVIARIDQSRILVGSANFLHNHGVNAIDHNLPTNQTAIMVAKKNTIIGAITFADTLRPEANRTLKGLDRLGISDRLMLTGDNKSVAESIAEQLGVTEVHANCLPQDKINIIKHLQPQRRPVAMIGDGVNDAPTLAAADVGIALGAHGSTAASQSADIVIMLDDLGKVGEITRIAQGTITIARQSILIGIGLSIGLMLIATSGIIPPITGALSQELIDIGVILNALRALRT